MSTQRTCLSTVLVCVTEVLITKSYVMSAKICLEEYKRAKFEINKFMQLSLT